MKHHPGIDFFFSPSLSKGQSREPFITVKRRTSAISKCPSVTHGIRTNKNISFKRMCKINEPNRKFKKKKKFFPLSFFFPPLLFLSQVFENELNR